MVAKHIAELGYEREISVTGCPKCKLQEEEELLYHVNPKVMSKEWYDFFMMNVEGNTCQC